MFLPWRHLTRPKLTDIASNQFLKIIPVLSRSSVLLGRNTFCQTNENSKLNLDFTIQHRSQHSDIEVSSGCVGGQRSDATVGVCGVWRQRNGNVREILQVQSMGKAHVVITKTGNRSVVSAQNQVSKVQRLGGERALLWLGLQSRQYPHNVAWNGRTADESESTWDEAIVTRYTSKYCSFIFLERMRKTVDTSVKIANVPNKIRLAHLLINILQLVDRLSQTDTRRSALD
jgi:hypothetical protein